MSKAFTSLILVFFSLSSFGQGINFESGDWQDVLALAKSKDKILFVDAYAQWCGPCKVMARTTFKDKAVGQFFNENFVNLKLDMETPNGRTFNVEHPVSAYPTMYFLSPDGEIIKKIVGSQQVEGLLAHANAAVKGAINLEALAQKYDEGNRDYDFMLKYIQALSTVGKPNLKLANDYLDSNPQWSKEERVRFLFESTSEADSRLFEMMVKEKDLVIEIYGQNKYEAKIKKACNATVEKAIDFEVEDLLIEATGKADANLLSDASSYIYDAKTNYYTSLNLADKYLNASLLFAQSFAKSDKRSLGKLVNEMCLNYPDDTAIIENAIDLSKKHHKKHKDSSSLNIYCNVLLLTNQADKALTIAKKALKKEKKKSAQKDIRQIIQLIEQNLDQ